MNNKQVPQNISMWRISTEKLPNKLSLVGLLYMFLVTLSDKFINFHYNNKSSLKLRKITQARKWTN